MGVARSYNLNFGIQQNVGCGTVVDVGYVGTLGRHLNWALRPGSDSDRRRFDPANRDPTTGSRAARQFPARRTWATAASPIQLGRNLELPLAAGHGRTAVSPADSSSALPGPGRSGWMRWTSTATSSRRSFRRAAGTTDSRSFDRTHNLRINFLYDVPQHAVEERGRAVGAQRVAGHRASMPSSAGHPSSVGFTTTNNADITGTPSSGARMVRDRQPGAAEERADVQPLLPDRRLQRAGGRHAGQRRQWLFRGPASTTGTSRS